MQPTLYLTAVDVTADLAKVDAEINAIMTRIRRLPDRAINTRPHIEMVAERRRLMAERDALLARLCDAEDGPQASW